jgi:hypothetical protein
VRGCARCRFCIKPPHAPKARSGARVRNVAKIGQIIFSDWLRLGCRRRTWNRDNARKQAEKRAFSIHGRDGGGLAKDFMRVCCIRCRKAAWHGRLRASPTQDPKTPDGESRAVGSGSLILRRKQTDRFPVSQAPPWGPALTLPGPDAMGLRLSRRTMRPE